MRFLTSLVSIAVLTIIGCSTPQPLLRCSKIPMPGLPERVELEKPGAEKKPGTRYLKEPTLLQPQETYQAPDGGSIVWSSGDWRHIRYGLVENRKAIDAMEKLIRQHNNQFEPNKQKPWYEGFWSK